MGVQSFQSKPAMISLLVLVATASCAPQYGPPPPIHTPTSTPEKLIAPAVTCTVTYVTVWDTEYHDNEKEVCVTEYEKVCNTEFQRLCQPTTRQECTTEYEQQCSTIYKNVCVQKYRTEYEPYTETECSTVYKQDCQYQWEGEGNDKVWAPIDGTCQNVPYDECKEVEKSHARQVAFEACHEEPEESCVSVPKEVCISVADEVCKNEPLTKCEEVPRQACHKEHRRVPIRVSKAVPKKSCGTNQVVPPSQFPPIQPQLPAVQPRPFPEAPEVSEVFIPQPVPAVPASSIGPDQRILDNNNNNIEFGNTGADPSEVIDVAKLTAENSSAIKFSEV